MPSLTIFIQILHSDWEILNFLFDIDFKFDYMHFCLAKELNMIICTNNEYILEVYHNYF
jgi:hypothetical protein